MMLRLSRATTACLLGVLFLVGCAPADTPEDMLARAKAATDTGDTRTATIELKNLLREHPRNAEGRWRLGNLYLQLGQGGPAVKELDQAQRLGKRGPDMTLSLLRARLLLGQFKEVLGTLSTRDGVSKNADLLVVRAQAHLGLRRFADAGRTLQKALKLNPESRQAQRGLARVALSNRDFDTAAEELDKSLSLSQDDVQTWLLKGELELSRGNFEASLSAFKSAEQLLAAAPAVRVGIARALLGLGRTAEADEYLIELHKASPNHPLVNYFRAVSARQQNNASAAHEALRDVLRVQPDHLQALLLMGAMQYAAGEFLQAEDFLLRFNRAVPQHLPGRKLLAAVQLRLSNPADAIKTLEPALASVPDDPQLLAMLGSAHLSDRNAEAGTELLARAAALDPNAAAIRTQLALSHLAAGSADKALSQLETAVDLDPSFTRAELLLVFTHLRNRDWANAEDTAATLAKKQPDDPVPLNLLGAAFAGQGQIERAREHYRRALEISPTYLNAALNLASLDVRDGKLEEALQTYHDIVVENPRHEQAALALARLHGRMNNVARAVALLESTRAQNEQAVQLRVALANIYLRQNNAAGALQIAEEASRLASKNPAVLVVLGQALAATGEPRRSLSAFEDLARYQPNSADAHYQLALAHARVDARPSAMASLEKSLSINPRHFGARVALGNFSIKAGNPAEALKIASALGDEFPNNPASTILRGDAFLADKQWTKAEQAYADALRVQKSSALVLKRYRALASSGDANGAKAILQDWMRDNPSDAVIRLTLASLAHQSGDEDIAIEEYEKVLEAAPKSVMALNNLAWLYFERGDNRAVDYARRAFEGAPKRAEIMDTFGWILVRSGETEQGLALLEKAARAAPNLAEIHYHLAAALAKAGDKTRSKSILGKVLKSAQDFPTKEDAQKLFDSL